VRGCEKWSAIENRLRRVNFRLSAGKMKPGQTLGEFRKFFTEAGIAGSCWSAPLAKLGTARAEAISGSTRQAKQAFLALWKGTDADIPMLKQATAEAAKFH